MNNNIISKDKSILKVVISRRNKQRAQLNKHKKNTLSREKRKKRIRLKQKNIYLSRSELADKLKEKINNNQCESLAAPINFSLRENTALVLQYFDEIYKKIRHGNPVLINVADIKNITIDSLLYLIALSKRLESDAISYSITGNAPNDYKCSNLLKDSGFLKYWNGTIDTIQSTDSFKITDGQCVEPRIAADVCKFVHDKLNISKLETKNLFIVLIELMNNTKLHAYTGMNGTLKNWYIFARYDESQNFIEFAFLDTGYGIPHTINKNLKEKFNDWASKLGLKKTKNSDYIKSALDGAYASGKIISQTKLKHHGKGLPKIFNIYKNNMISDLYILSGHGGFDNGILSDYKNLFKGTFFSWKFIKPRLSNENN
jgi:hypothetical protein